MPDAHNRGVFWEGGWGGACDRSQQQQPGCTRPWWQPGGAFVPVTEAGDTGIHRQLLVMCVYFYIFSTYGFYPNQSESGTGSGLLCSCCLSAVFCLRGQACVAVSVSMCRYVHVHFVCVCVCAHGTRSAPLLAGPGTWKLWPHLEWATGSGSFCEEQSKP